MKKIFKGIIPMLLVLLTSCNIPTKQALGYTEKTINLSKDMNHISDIKYLGQDIYAVNTSTDEKLAEYKLMDSSGNLISNNIFYDVDPDLKFNVKKTIPVMVTDFTKHKKLKYSLINTKGKFVSKNYDTISPIGKDIYEVLKGDKYGYIDSTGKEITSLIKMTSNTLNDPNCRPYKDKSGKYEFLNKEGKNIAPYEFDDFQYTTSSKDLISVYKNHKWGFINKKGTVIKDFQFEDVNGFCEDLISVKQNGKWGCMDRSGNITIPFKFDKPVVFTNGIAIVDIDSKEGAIDSKGNFLVLPKFDCIKPEFNCGLAMVQLGNLTGVIDIKGNYIIKPNNIYNVYQWDSKSIVMIKNIGNADILDISSKKIKNLNYKQICGFQNDIIFISENNKWGLIHKTGKILKKPQFDKTINFINGFAVVLKQGKFGVLDTKGNYKIPVKYNKIKHIYRNYYIAKLDNKWGVIDINNKIVKEFEYDNAAVVELENNSKTQLFLTKGTKGLVLDFEN